MQKLTGLWQNLLNSICEVTGCVSSTVPPSQPGCKAEAWPDSVGNNRWPSAGNSMGTRQNNIFAFIGRLQNLNGLKQCQTTVKPLNSLCWQALMLQHNTYYILLIFSTPVFSLCSASYFNTMERKEGSFIVVLSFFLGSCCVMLNLSRMKRKFRQTKAQLINRGQRVKRTQRIRSRSTNSDLNRFCRLAAKALDKWWRDKHSLKHHDFENVPTYSLREHSNCHVVLSLKYHHYGACLSHCYLVQNWIKFHLEHGSKLLLRIKKFFVQHSTSRIFLCFYLDSHCLQQCKF